MTYPIEDGVPLPERSSTELTQTVAALLPGQSALVPFDQSKTAAYAYKVRKKTGAKFSTRVADGGTRVWRLS